MGKCTRCGASAGFLMSLCEACISAGEATRAQSAEPITGPREGREGTAAPDKGSRKQVPERCPHCQGTKVRTDGWAGPSSRVQFGKRWMGTGDAGYGLNCFACLDCGYVGNYLGPGDLQRLRSVPVMADWPPASSRSGCLGTGLLLIAVGIAACLTAGRLLAD